MLQKQKGLQTQNSTYDKTTATQQEAPSVQLQLDWTTYITHHNVQWKLFSQIEIIQITNCLECLEMQT